MPVKQDVSRVTACKVVAEFSTVGFFRKIVTIAGNPPIVIQKILSNQKFPPLPAFQVLKMRLESLAVFENQKNQF